MCGFLLYCLQRKAKVWALELHDALISSATWQTAPNNNDPAVKHTPAGSVAQLVQLMLPSDCVNFNRNGPVSVRSCVCDACCVMWV